MAVQTRMITLVLFVVALGLGVVSTALDYWYYYSTKDKSSGQKIIIYIGLWERCIHSGEKTMCKTNEDATGNHSHWIHGCQAMMIIGLVLNVLAFLHTLYSTIKQASLRGAQVLAVLSGICYIIAAVIFAAKYKDDLQGAKNGGHLHAGFGLAMVAGVVNLINTCLLGYGYAGVGYQTM